MPKLSFEATLAHVGLQPSDVERALGASAINGASASLQTHLVTVTTAAELRQVLNPHGIVHPVQVPALDRVHAGDAAPGSSWAARQLGRPPSNRAHAMDILHAVALGPEDALQTHGRSVEKAWLPNRVAVTAAQSLNIAKGQVYVLGNPADRTTVLSAVFDTITIAAGGQLVFANPTFLTVNTLSRLAA